jgi:hypothetical protein
MALHPPTFPPVSQLVSQLVEAAQLPSRMKSPLPRCEHPAGVVTKLLFFCLGNGREGRRVSASVFRLLVQLSSFSLPTSPIPPRRSKVFCFISSRRWALETGGGWKGEINISFLFSCLTPVHRDPQRADKTFVRGRHYFFFFFFLQPLLLMRKHSCVEAICGDKKTSGRKSKSQMWENSCTRRRAKGEKEGKRRKKQNFRRRLQYPPRHRA